MSDTADRLAALLDTVPARLVEFSDAEASVRPANGHWSKKEILGHLIDSATNNHIRFVLASLDGEFRGGLHALSLKALTPAEAGRG